MHYASKAYAKTAQETVGPRQLEARLLLQATARLQAVQDAWGGEPDGLAAALLFNRQLWLVFMDAVMRDDNRLPRAVRQNILNLGGFVLAETFSLMTRPQPRHLANIIRINRAMAAGLSGRPDGKPPKLAA